MKEKVKILLLCVFYITINLKAKDFNTKKDSLDAKTFYLDEITLIESQIPIKRKESGRSIIKIDSIELKRFIGRRSTEVDKSLIEKYPYSIDKNEEKIGVYSKKLKKRFECEEISAQILLEIKSNAERFAALQMDS